MKTIKKKTTFKSVSEGRGTRIVIDMPAALVEALDDLKTVFGYNSRNKIIGFMIQDTACRVGTGINTSQSILNKEQRKAIRRCRSFAAAFQIRQDMLSSGFYPRPKFALVPVTPELKPNMFDRMASRKRKERQ